VAPRVKTLIRNLVKVGPLVHELIERRTQTGERCEVSGFRRQVDENWALLGCYAASSGNGLPTFRDFSLILKEMKEGCSETSVRNCHYALRNSQEQRSSQDSSRVFIKASPLAPSFTFNSNKSPT